MGIGISSHLGGGEEGARVVVISEPAGSIATKLCGLMTYAVLFSFFLLKSVDTSLVMKENF